MFRKPVFQILFVGLLLTTLLLGVASPVRAFDGRGGDIIRIASGETVDDNLYVGAQTFTMDGTVKGDIFAAGNTITINGTVEGDVMAAGQTVIINGTVNGDVRMAGGALYMGEKASVTGEVLAFGGSFETRKGNLTGKDLVFYGGQALLAGDVNRNVWVGTGGLKIEGNIKGNVDVGIGDSANSGPAPSAFLPQTGVAVPNVARGLNIDPAVKIGGKLVYTSSKELTLPENIAGGGIQHRLPVVRPEAMVKTLTPLEQTSAAIFNVLRQMVTLILFGLMMVWLFPVFLKKAVDRIQSAPLPLLGWGIVSWAGFFFAVLVLIVATIVLAVIFGTLTLNSLSAVIIWLGILSFFILVMGFVLASTFVAQILISMLGGKLILARFKPEWSEHKIWPLVIGVVIFAVLCALPVVGWLINLVATLFGLGVIWTLGRYALTPQPLPTL